MKWIEINMDWNDFRSHELCTPGVLIECTWPGQGGERLLIGDINSMGGTCDDCPWGISTVTRALDIRPLIASQEES